MRLKTLADAVELRNRIFGAFEEAERATDPTRADEWLTFVVVGGGATGVEVAGQLAILSRHAMRAALPADRSADGAGASCSTPASALGAAFSEQLSAKAAESSPHLGVSVRESSRVTSIDADGVTIEADGRASGSRTNRHLGGRRARRRR